MITHNRRDEVLRTVLHTCSLPDRPSVIVVDNGSRDGTPEAIAEKFAQVRLFRAGRNLGAAARTLGARQASTPYVAFSDDDTHWQPESLQRAVELFDKHRRLAIVTARVLVGPEGREDSACAEMASSPLPIEAGMPGRPLLGFLAGASAARRSAFLECGGFDPRFFLGGEEELLATDLATREWWICYVPELLVRHYPSPARDSNGRRWRLRRNALWFAWLRRPWASAIRRTRRLLASDSWDGATLHGVTAALAGLPWVLRRRNVVPPAVERGLRLLDDAASGKR